ncbi:hypothetical protein BM449_00705 [Synechococcus sp. SynAce01]|nr:hypothetical protein BM449_00705 [Synechococcus sp. SynAce01]
MILTFLSNISLNFSRNRSLLLYYFSSFWGSAVALTLAQALLVDHLFKGLRIVQVTLGHQWLFIHSDLITTIAKLSLTFDWSRRLIESLFTILETGLIERFPNAINRGETRFLNSLRRAIDEVSKGLFCNQVRAGFSLGAFIKGLRLRPRLLVSQILVNQSQAVITDIGNVLTPIR